ncbi:hypothetical protein AAY86_00955 [Pseudomonas amygdali pv. tabaci str. ATCC 11528]|uniref:hypothetical protein n=1 Tax=Pseudomonas syringae group TaxID=136849 RepID=UPI00062B4326|nr:MULTISPECIES: hypothetical protein [Pseudomonas syringae group]KKY54719.1 hypothetical protein AAY86_00955 [Pseudomonas amygdali pv. tabaci str. ATCC 11528]QED83662.1 hypothetical protein PSYTB_08225 [Pseudomonas amygdali pv. tabaci str. ATCC 11528]RXT62865.1 hypothetical protein B1F71_23420 [Pseudomonas syringae]RXT92577.1 hypothetical protein B1F75_15385 [Pseudomonas syringae]
MHPLFMNLKKQILDIIEDQLTNNEEAPDAEIRNILVDELDLTIEQADAAIAMRPRFRCEIFIAGQSPLYQTNTVTFDPHQKKLVAAEPLSFDQILEIYTMLLKSRPGYRLKLGAHWAAGLNSEGELYCTHLNPCDKNIMFEVYDFDRDAFVNGRWQYETEKQTRAAIENPVFIR